MQGLTEPARLVRTETSEVERTQPIPRRSYHDHKAPIGTDPRLHHRVGYAEGGFDPEPDTGQNQHVRQAKDGGGNDWQV